MAAVARTQGGPERRFRTVHKLILRIHCCCRYVPERGDVNQARLKARRRFPSVQNPAAVLIKIPEDSLPLAEYGDGCVKAAYRPHPGRYPVILAAQALPVAIP